MIGVAIPIYNQDRSRFNGLVASLTLVKVASGRAREGFATVTTNQQNEINLHTLFYAWSSGASARLGISFSEKG